MHTLINTKKIITYFDFSYQGKVYASIKGMADRLQIGIFYMLMLAMGMMLFFVLTFVLYRALPTIQEFSSGLLPPGQNELFITTDSVAISNQLFTANNELSRLQKALDKRTPKSNYLVINTTENKFRLYAGRKLLSEGICSTGSYTLLTDEKENKWYFQTPKGIFRIRDKKTSPVWKKPDWAFVEEGLPVPSPNHFSRFEYGTLGDYALSLGDGYLIHGTLYQRFLGLPVTHGCVRMGDNDLKIVYQTLQIGAYVYIY